MQQKAIKLGLSPHISAARETDKFVSDVMRRREMVVLDDLGHFAAGLRLRSVNDDGGVIVAVDLTAFDFLQPAILGDLGHSHTF